MAELKPPRHLRRNFLLFLADFLFFGTAFSMVGATTVVPDFVSRLTTSDVVIGLSSSLYTFSWLVPQLLFAQVVNRRTRRKPFMGRTVIPFRLSMGVMAAIIFFSGPENHTGILITFLAFYYFFALGDGLVTVVWADMLGSCIPERWRGPLFGLGQILVAFTALGTRELVRLILGSGGPAFPQNYGILFGIATVGFVLGGIALASTVEEEQSIPIQPGPPMRQYLAYLGKVLRHDGDFRRLMLTRILFDLTTMAVPFYIVFGTMELKLQREAVVGDSILIGTLGTTVASVLIGWLSGRSGSRAVIRLSGVASLLHPLLALVSISAGQPALYATFFLFGFVNASTAPGYFDWIITHAPPDRRPIYVGLANTISAVSHLAPFLGGFILAQTSYSVLFGVTGGIAVLGLASSLFISEPRRRTTPLPAAVLAQPTTE
jgi:MFS family permease